jgi:hypothetical protein
MYVYHGTQYPQRVQRTLIRNPEIIRVRLDPAKRTLLDNLKTKREIFQSGTVRMGCASSGRTSPRGLVSLRCPLP